MKRCILCMQELDLFADLKIEQRRNLCMCTEKRKVKKSHCLYRQGDKAVVIYLIKAGKFKIVQSQENGEESILDICGVGEILGELDFLRENEMPTTAIAMEDACVCCLSRNDFIKLIKEDPNFAMRIISYLGAKRYDDVRFHQEEKHQRVKEKLLALLYRLGEKYGEPHPSGILIHLKITQQELGDMVGASRVSVVRALKELEKMDALNREKPYYVLKDDPCIRTHTFTPKRDEAK